ncbi:MAG: ECF-type sigma factor [Phycisphaerales bacterium]
MKTAHEPTNAEPSGDRGTLPDEREIYATLRGLAAVYLRAERANHSLQPTALVNEAYLKLAQGAGAGRWRSQTHFQTIAANVMRQILVDHARRRATQKRGGGRLRVTLSPNMAATPDRDVELIALDEAMNKLAELDSRKAKLVELRFFGGLTCTEAAERLGMSPKTAEADWYFARAWLRDRLRNGEA